jgi:hypothetical protein
MGLLFRLLMASPKCARAFYYCMVGVTLLVHIFVGEAKLEAFQNWLWGPPQEQQQRPQQPALDHEVEVLFAVFQQHMDEQYQVNILASEVLTLPALPEEGF